MSELVGKEPVSEELEGAPGEDIELLHLNCRWAGEPEQEKELVELQ